MSRLTLALPDALHRALKEAAAVRGKTIGELVAESVVAYGIKPREEAERWVARARERASLPEARALELAVAETRASRGSGAGGASGAARASGAGRATRAKRTRSR